MEETKTGTVFIRTKKERNYTVMDNTFLRDERLSAKAKGIFAYILYLPEDWCIYQSELVKHFSDGKDALRAAIKELETLGYISKEHIKDIKTGRFTHWQYTVNETPKTPEADFPKLDFPKLENPPLLNTDNKINTNNTNSSTSLKYDDFPEPDDFPTETTTSKKKNRTKKISAEEKHKQYLSSLPSEIVSLSEKCADKLVSHLIRLQNSRTPAAHKLAWQEDFARFLVAENKSEKEILAIIDSAMTGWWADKIYSADGLIKQYGKLYQQLNSSYKSDYQKNREDAMERGNMNTGNRDYLIF